MSISNFKTYAATYAVSKVWDLLPQPLSSQTGMHTEWWTVNRSDEVIYTMQQSDWLS